jgi:N-acyl-D-amino-acid deacylase
VAPGFIDAHTHDDRALLSMPDMTPKVSQGVTSLVAGNCGVSLAPLMLDGIPPAPLDLLGNEAGWFRFGRFGEYAEALRDAPPALNCGLLVGHITLRHRVMDRFDRPARAGEIAEMRRQVGTAMVDGAIGFSTGLDYPPAVAAPTEEIVALVEAVKPHGGLYCAHHRNYFERLEAAIDEALASGGRRRCRSRSHTTNAPVPQISAKRRRRSRSSTGRDGTRRSGSTPIPMLPARRR